MSLQSIANQVRACTRCELRESATQPVPGVGEVGVKYLLLGEAPGSNEDKEGIPFIGLAGKRLNQLLELAGIDINDCYLTNVCKCQPPKVEGKQTTPRKKQIKACWRWLAQEIALVQPEYIITLGACPLSLFTETGVSQLHGTLFTIDLDLEKPL